MRLTLASRCALFCGWLFAVVACENSTLNGERPCTSHLDCVGVQLCIEERCTEAEGATCQSDVDCPDGLKCVDGGRCQAGVECEASADCCAPGIECSSRCVDYRCIGSACTPGETRACFVGCHRGNRSCDSGSWGACDAEPVTAEELCGDDIDNDCNGVIDEGCAVCTAGETRTCSGACGDGEQTCQADGTFGPCDAPTSCICQPGQTRSEPCGNCGYTESTCGQDGIFSPSGVCLGEGVCAPGEEEVRACGSCGEQRRTCLDGCSWGEWSPCEAPAEACVPGTLEERGCGTCGAQTRTCDDDCTFSQWGVCAEGNGCTPGQTQTQPCGRCGVRISTCDGQCGWSAYGACRDEGVCTPGQVETEACGQCGERSRVCTDACGWGPWSACEAQGVCTPGTTEYEACGPETEEGICRRGERSRTCNASCQWDAPGACIGAVYPDVDICGNGIDESCSGYDFTFPDDYEINDTCLDCFWLGEDPEEVVIYPSFDSYDDLADWFCFRGVDNFNLVGTPGENIEVDVTQIPAGMDLDVELYRGGCGAENRLAAAEQIGDMSEYIVWEEGAFSDETDTYYVRVVGYGEPSCYLPYTLRVHGLR